MAKNKDIVINGNIDAKQHYVFETEEYYYSIESKPGLAFNSKKSLCDSLGEAYKNHIDLKKFKKDKKEPLDYSLPYGANSGYNGDLDVRSVMDYYLPDFRAFFIIEKYADEVLNVPKGTTETIAYELIRKSFDKFKEWYNTNESDLVRESYDIPVNYYWGKEYIILKRD